MDPAGIKLTTSSLRQHHQLPVVQHICFMPLKLCKKKCSPGFAATYPLQWQRPYSLPNPDNIAEAAHQRAGSGSCGHPRRSRQRTGGESANWLCSGPAPAEPSLPPSCQQRAGRGPAPAPDSAGASRIFFLQPACARLTYHPL